MLVIIIFVWLFPIKLSLPVSNNFICNAEQKGYTVLLCHIDQITGPLWKIKSSYNSNVSETHIDIIGNIPNDWFKNPIYCYDVDFLFVGEFIDDTVFEVKEWKSCGMVLRRYEMHPFYPLYGFNIFEKK